MEFGGAETKIGIVVPVYNAERYIKKCVSSIMRQSYPDWVLVVVDDGSTDKTPDILDKLAATDPRIHVIHQNNSGSVLARRAGILSDEIQSCGYCSFCDADDYLDPECLKKLYQEVIKKDADLVVGRVEKYVNGIVIHSEVKHGCFAQAPIEYDNNSIIRDLYVSFFGISDFPVCLYAKLYRTKKVTEALWMESPVKFFGDDQYITLQVVPQAQKIVIIPDVIYYYRIGGGTSKLKEYMLDDFIALYRFKKPFIERYPMPQDAGLFLDIEMINIVKDYLNRCAVIGKYSDDRLGVTIEKTCDREIVKDAAIRIAATEVYNSSFARLITQKKTMEIAAEVSRDPLKQKIKRTVKSILLH